MICVIFITSDVFVQERERHEKKAAVMEIKLKPKKYYEDQVEDADLQLKSSAPTLLFFTSLSPMKRAPTPRKMAPRAILTKRREEDLTRLSGRAVGERRVLCSQPTGPNPLHHHRDD
jgi:hypothetical protein